MEPFSVKVAAEEVICAAIVITKPIQISIILVFGRIARLTRSCKHFIFE